MFIIYNIDVTNLSSRNRINYMHKMLGQAALNIEKILEILNYMKSKVNDVNGQNIEYVIDTISN
jgi:hypothetical protein